MKLKKSLIVMDLETTGTWIEKDRIIEIAMIRLHPDGKREHYDKRVNPGIPIPPVVSELTGITDADVKDAPPFRAIAGEVLEFIQDCDFGGFNVERFDLPLLEREMFEAGYNLEWQKQEIYDAQRVYHLNEKRDLSAAYKFYCDKELQNAHSALADAEATFEILERQVRKYGDGSEDLDSLAHFHYKTAADFFDTGRRFRWWNGELYPMFGKYAKRASLREIARKDPDYLQWILNKDFSDEVKELAEAALSGRFPVQGEDRYE